MAINFLGLPQHFENTEQLREAERQGLISEPQYKTMSGYDASKNVWGLGDLMGPLQPAANVATSGIYNIGKSIFTPQDYFDPNTYQAKVGPLESTGYNVEGALLGLNPELKEKYEGILGLDRRSLTDTWAPEDLTDFSGVYDDEETITFNPNDPKVKQAGLPLKKLWDIYRAYKVGKKIKKHGPQVLGTLTGILKGQDTKAEVPSKKIVTPPRGGGADVMPIPPSRKTYVSPARPHAGYEQSGGSAQQDRGPPGGDPGWKGARGGYVDRALRGRSRYL